MLRRSARMRRLAGSANQRCRRTAHSHDADRMSQGDGRAAIPSVPRHDRACDPTDGSLRIEPEDQMIPAVHDLQVSRIVHRDDRGPRRSPAMCFAGVIQCSSCRAVADVLCVRADGTVGCLMVLSAHHICNWPTFVRQGPAAPVGPCRQVDTVAGLATSLGRTVLRRCP